MEKHYVEFYSPGTFFPESTAIEISSWDVHQAVELSKGIKERHDATPFGFRFSTRRREDNELDSKQVSQSAMYYLGGKIETLEEIESRNDPEERILLANMRMNDWNKVIVNTNSYKITRPLLKGDVVLDYTPSKED